MTVLAFCNWILSAKLQDKYKALVKVLSILLVKWKNNLSLPPTPNTCYAPCMITESKLNLLPYMLNISKHHEILNNLKNIIRIKHFVTLWAIKPQ